MRSEEKLVQLTHEELLNTNGGYSERYYRRNAARSWSALSNSDRKAAVGAQSSVTGWGGSAAGLALAVPTGGGSLVLSGIGMLISTASLGSL